MKYLLTIFALLYSITLPAQTSLCLSKGDTANSLNFDGAQVNNYLHLEKYKAVFFGEQHNPTFDPEIIYQLITTLNKYCGTRHFFMEISVSYAWHFNQYLLTGDTTYLHGIKLGSFFTFWQRLYTYNKQLPDGLKMVIHGIDFERTDVFSTILELAPKNGNIPLTLQPIMDTIKAHLQDKPLAMFIYKGNKLTDVPDHSSFTATLSYIQDQLRTHSADTKAYFGDHYPVIEDIINNKSKAMVKPGPRNKTMYQNMRRIVASQHIEKFAGFFGGAHTDYRTGNALANTAADLPGIQTSDVLNITEIVYNRRAQDGTPFQLHIDKLDEIIKLNGNCKATLIPAEQVPGYKKAADYVLIANDSN